MIRLILLIFSITVILSHILPGSLYAEDNEKREVYITLPTVCHQVEKIEGNKVHLRSPDETCIQVTTKKEIMLDKKYDTVQIYIDGGYSHDEKVMEGFDIDNLRDYFKQTDEYKKELQNSDFYRKKEWLKNKEAEEESKKAFDVYQSEEFQRKIKEETEKLKAGIFAEYSGNTEKYYKDMNEDRQSVRHDWLSGDKVYIMISRSVPMQTLRNYVKSIVAMNLNATMVMRGFVGGVEKIMPTVKFIMDVIKKDPSCEWSITHPCETYDTGITIDPTLFRTYGIEEVPSIVIAKGIPEGNATPKEAYILTGDVSLDYAIEKVASFQNKHHTSSYTPPEQGR